MIVRKIFGILAFSVQAVIAADFFIQTRDAGLQWGELSSAQYRDIVAARFAKVPPPELLRESKQAVAWAPSPATPVKMPSQVSAKEGAAPICVRRGTTLDCN